MNNKSKILSYQKVLEKRLFFRYLLHVNEEPGVYALINNKQKKIYIQSSSNITKHLGDLISQISIKICTNKEMVRDRKYLSIKILELGDYPAINKLKWIAHYEAEGFIIYNQEKIPQYTPRTRPVHSVVVRTQVQLVSNGRRVQSVKNFPTKKEAEDFIATTTVFDMLKMIASGHK